MLTDGFIVTQIELLEESRILKYLLICSTDTHEPRSVDVLLS